MQINLIASLALSTLLITSSSAAYTFRCAYDCNADPAATLPQTTYACSQCRGTMAGSVCVNALATCFGGTCKNQHTTGCLGTN
ncbi:unnamed protein product [Tilletia controversa]|uniref:Uncharacterized protein n=3 Tax=Tilletia TaxID=13289 RepID=A0A8X7SW59_9BASI|nr:hypothetical protein CF336_g4363 [Tilletia laevis]KAE8196764.1 hypothetical protein CF328_g4047 [Tilletia controversa]KAE8260882.1 hypothetical protein A4X03_0g3679 [Tilletia caries]KAE8202468.1 hypothetical protein CF335_g3404 [Tilletia laevis]KAE8246965.1 hypothetical protein A4X06_0g4795 [Tilletia controversa]